MDTTEINYGDFVQKLAKDGETIAKELTGDDAHLLHMAIGVSGEAGELLDAVKRVAIYRKEIDIENVIEELGDLEFYMEGLRQGLNITREETIKANKQKLSKRYSSLSYSDSQANARADKE